MPCMCGDPDCASCGPAQGTRGYPDGWPDGVDVVVGQHEAPDLSLREHGLRPSGEPLGPPTWTAAGDYVPPCPNCGARVCEVSVKVRHPLVRGGVGIARYLGCPACPMATPTIVTALPREGGA